MKSHELGLTKHTRALLAARPKDFVYPPRDLDKPYVNKDNRPVKRYVKTGTKANAYFQKDRIMAVIGMNIN